MAIFYDVKLDHTTTQLDTKICSSFVRCTLKIEIIKFANLNLCLNKENYPLAIILTI